MTEAAYPARTSDRAAWIVLVLVVAGSLFFTVHPWYDPTNDGSIYIATARSLAAGEGYSFLGEAFLIRPPGFAVLIAPLVAGGNDFRALNLFVSLSGAVGVIGFHFLLRRRLGAWLALLVALAVWVSPGYQRLCNQVMSDVPGWAALVGCLLLARRAERGRLLAVLGLGLAIGLAAMLRFGNLLLVPALLASWFLGELTAERRDWARVARRGAGLVLGAVLVVAPWGIRNRLVAPPPPAEQTLGYSYSSCMWHQDMGDPRSPRVPLREVLARFPRQGTKILRTLGTALRDEGSGAGVTLVAFVLLSALLLNAVRRREPEELFALGILLVVAFYFSYAGRLLLPVFAFALAALVELLREGVGRVAGARAGWATAALACVAWIAVDWQPRWRWDEIAALHRAYERSAERIVAALPEGARLGAFRGWHHSVFLERPVWSFEGACVRAKSPVAAEAVIDAHRIDTVLLTPVGLPAKAARAERAFAAYVARRYHARKVGLVRVR